MKECLYCDAFHELDVTVTIAQQVTMQKHFNETEAMIHSKIAIQARRNLPFPQ